MAGPLNGIKVVDLSRFIAGPYCGMLLADMGAEVIKVEKIGGEDTRKVPPFVQSESLYTMALNRNKRAITLNYRHALAYQVLKRLIQWADILIENFRPGTLEKMGLGAEKLKTINPGLITVRCSGFGQTGPLKNRPGFDAIAQAMSGIMSMTGSKDDPPLLAGTFVVDYATGMHAAVGALSALHHRNITGVGQVVDVSLFESAVSMLVSAIPDYQLNGNTPERVGNRDRFAAPCNSYLSQDGWVYIAASNEGLWSRLCTLMNRQDLLEEPNLKTVVLRVQHAEEVDEIVQQWVAKYRAEEVVSLLDEVGIPCAKIRGVEELLNDPHLRERGQIVDTEHPTIGRMSVSGVTIKLSETPGQLRYGPPMIGQHNQEVYLRELGFSQDEWELFHNEGVC